MKNKQYLKLFLDILMGVIFLLLMNVKFTGLVFHELVAIFIFIVMVTHIILNIKWMKSIGKNLKNKNVKIKQKVKFIISIITFISIFTLMLTGILISQYIFPSISIGNREFIYSIHKQMSIISLGLVFFHIGIHLEYFISMVETIKNDFKEGRGKKIVIKFIISVIILVLLYIPISAHLENKSYNSREAFEKSPKGRYEDDTNNKFNEKEPKEDTGKEDDKKSKDNNKSTNNSGVTDKSIEDYLAKLTCKGCGKHCLLSNPRCNVGAKQAQEAIEQYNTSNSETSDTNGDI